MPSTKLAIDDLTFTVSEMAVILVPFDGSPRSEEILDFACDLAFGNAIRILALYSVLVPKTLPLFDLPEEIDHKGMIALSRARDILGANGCAGNTLLVHGRTLTRVIIREAIIRDARAILVPAEERTSWVRRMISPSLQHMLERRAACPVIAVKTGAPNRPLRKGDVLRNVEHIIGRKPVAGSW